MTPFMQLAIALVIIITAAKAGGYLSYRIGQPSVLGELLAGVVLGPSVLNLLHFQYFSDEHIAETIHYLGEIGVLLLMFVAGLELHLTDLLKSRKVAVLAGMLGVLFPMLFGAGLGKLFSTSMSEALFIGLILAATSVSISAQTLMELKVLRSRVGISLLGSAVFDDVLVVLGLSIFIALSSPQPGSGWANILLTILEMVLYLVIATSLGMFLLPTMSRTVKNLPISQALIAFTIVIVLLYGWTAEELGNMAAITGSFLAGLSFARTPVKERIESGILPLAYGLFVPVFFVNVGLAANVRELVGENFWLFLAMTVVAILSKVFGAGLGGELGGLKRREALQLGIGMMSRGEVGLIVASVGITQGVIPQNVFSSIVGVVVITTLLTPPMLRLSFSKHKPQEPDKGEKPSLPEAHSTFEGDQS
jgi:Kef-type K+ transport system membrane component KefB